MRNLVDIPFRSESETSDKVGFSSMVLIFVRNFNDFEVQGEPAIYFGIRDRLLSVLYRQVTGMSSRYSYSRKQFHVLLSFSLERIQQYLDIEQEPKPTHEGVPPASWPASGDLRVENLSARYSAVCSLRKAF